MTELKQLNPHFPKGDCMRTVFACLLNYDKPDLVPSFTEMEVDHPTMVKNFNKNVNDWLNQNGLSYIEVSLDSLKHAQFIPQGECVLVGKSPRGDWNHAVIGNILINPFTKHYDIFYKWDPSTLHDGVFLDGEPLYVGFLTKKI